MTDEEFFERLHRDAQELRYEPEDSAVWTRLQARIAQRIQAQPTPTQFLASWFRPVATALAVLSIIAALTVQWIDRPQQPTTVEAMASSHTADIGEALGVQ